jgi:tRNA(Arg) A34 adenosine deaminase TadA
VHDVQHVDPRLAERLMLDALAVAREGMMCGEAPIGCVLARGDGTIVARGHNEQNRSGDRIAHAEIVAFHRAAGHVPREAKDLILVSTLEPCVMCTGAAMEAAVHVVVFGLRAPADCGTTRVRPPSSPESHMPWVVGGVRSEASRGLFERWLPHIRDPRQSAYVRQLLALTGDGVH